MSGRTQTDSEQAAIETLKLIRHMRLTLGPLKTDYDENSGNKNQQFWRRAVIRCLLANLEAMIWNMKNIIPKIGLITSVQFTIEELEVVNEEKTVKINFKSIFRHFVKT